MPSRHTVRRRLAEAISAGSATTAIGTRRLADAISAGSATAEAGARRLSRAVDARTPDRLRPAVRWVQERRAVAAWSGATAVAFGALLLPGSAAALTVHPTTPGSSAFTAPAVPFHQPALVQVSKPSSYELPRSVDVHEAVTVAANLAPSTAGAPEPAAGPAAETAAPAPAPASAPAWSAPAPGASISNPFGKLNRSYAAGYHTGVDFAVSPGTPLLAVGRATVVSAAWDGAYGKEVVLRLADGHFAQYAHMSSLEVNAGQAVSAGQEIGRSGTTGNSTGPHLHFEIRSANRYAAVVDPIAYLSAHGVSDF
ncbi:M23 family metallopeptidase [Kitasatospora sp. GP82]|uniref:M23 family metallopeptidase n=1 Tax=Kitasatospora sp. GP82 TaxID=3035089 RepID=UPI002474ECEF|nr:M23 family metallopeptidase [Kitasatospora sp. GP82]MDH6124459.1 murein DD-endopeptidase MepM/ murein hydrolase activator NlpD [Kitasatospora sp. GP82]